jgi:hypothetical protein
LNQPGRQIRERQKQPRRARLSDARERACDVHIQCNWTRRVRCR